MNFASARGMALLLALALAATGVAHAQQYPFYESAYQGEDDSDPAPALEDGDAETAPPAPGAEEPGDAAPGDMPPGLPPGQPPHANMPNWTMPPAETTPMIAPPAGDGYLGGNVQYPPHDAGCTDGCCQAGCCNDLDLDCGCCLPHYVYARLDVIFMHRSRPNRGQPIATQGPGGPVVLTTSQLDFRWEPVERLLVGAPIDECTAVEISGMGLQTWQTQRFARTANLAAGQRLFSPFSNFGAGPLTAADNASGVNINYNSELRNIEVNLVHCLKADPCGRGRLDLVHGARWIGIYERFDYNTFFGGAGGTGLLTSATTVNANNDLFGYQLGCRWEYNLRPRWHVLFEPKAGLYYNSMSQRTAIGFTPGNVLVENPRRNEVAFAADATLTLSYDLASWCSVRFGYTVMNVTGVALAPENFAAQPAPGGALPRVPVVNVGGNILYQGASLGFEARF